MSYTEDQLKRIHTFLNYHLGEQGKQMPLDRQIESLTGRRRRFQIMMIVNVLALLFFAYWFLAGITALPNYVFYILLGIFLLNVFTVQYQKKQLQEAVDYLKATGGAAGPADGRQAGQAAEQQDQDEQQQDEGGTGYRG